MSDLIDRLINASDLIEWIMESFPDWCEGDVRAIINHIDDMPTHPTPSNTLGALDCIDRQMAIKAVKFYETFCDPYPRVIEALEDLPSAQPEEVIPHRNYKYLSDYWCECGNHLGKKGEVKYCSDCGRKVNWDG